MALNSENTWARRLALIALVVTAWASLPGTNSAQAANRVPDGSAVLVAEADAPTPNFFLQILQNLFDSHKLMDVLGQKEFTVLAFIALNLIVFVETGLLVGFFLPGDSLLVTAGIVCAEAGWPLYLLLATLCLAAIIGDSIGYSIGYKTGPKIFNREKSFFFHKEHLLAAERFYEAHGGKTIILARFMPIIRTFAPVVAGVGRMDYRRFLFFNVIGGVGWVVSMILIGYFIKDLINPLFRNMLGRPDFDVKDHVEKVIIIVVLLSIAPGGIVWLKKKLQGKQPASSVEPQVVGKAGE